MRQLLGEGLAGMLSQDSELVYIHVHGSSAQYVVSLHAGVRQCSTGGVSATDHSPVQAGSTPHGTHNACLSQTIQRTH